MSIISDEDLRAILAGFEIEEVEHLSRAQLDNLAIMFGILPPREDNVSPDLGIAGITNRTDEVAADMQEESSLLPTQSESVSNNVSSLTAENETRVGEEHQHSLVEDDSEEVKESIKSFCELVGIESSTARGYLEAAGWDLNNAMSLFMDSSFSRHINAASSTAFSPPIAVSGSRPSYRTMQLSAQESMRNARRRVRRTSDSESAAKESAEGESSEAVGESSSSNEAAVDLTNVMESSEDLADDDIMGINHRIDHFMSSFISTSLLAGALTGGELDHEGDDDGHMDDDDEMEYVNMNSAFTRNAGKQPDRYDEDGVRLPDPVRQLRLLSGNNGRMARGEDIEAVLARAEDPNIDWMFPVPRHLSNMSSLDETRSAAAAEGRWVLVNIQSHLEFTSEMLNRDTWRDETVESILRTTFMFWQRGHTSRDGQYYMRMYSLTEDKLPHIGIIDPRTGAKVVSILGFIGPQELTLKLVEFAESHPLAVPPPQLPIPASEVVTTGSGINEGSSVQNNLPPDSEKAEFISTTTAEPVAVESVIRYGLPSEEPAEGAPNVVKISIKLLNGKAFARRYLPSALVEELFRVAESIEPAVATSNRRFELVTRFPAASLLDCIHKTIGECNLSGSQIFFRWLD